MDKVSYKIFNDLSNPINPIYTTDGDICFYELRKREGGIGVNGGVYFFVSKVLDEKIVDWYQKKLNNIGFACIFLKHYEDGKSYLFSVKKTNYFKMLAILTALRYLQENDFPQMIKWCYNKCKQKKNEFLTFFQLMHYAGFLFNDGHSLCATPTSVYYQAYGLITLEGLKDNLSKELRSVHSVFENKKVLNQKERCIISLYRK